MARKPNPYGLHRVLQPKGVFPQAALKIDPTLPLATDEMLIQVDRLNIDSASFHEISQSEKGDLKKIEKKILSIIQSRGKMHNPVTNSGGMLLGTIKQIGKNFPQKKFKVGDRVATLVSLSLTPLSIDKILEVISEKEQVLVKGHAILFASGIAQKIPNDLPETLVLSVLDVCGAPALVSQYCKKLKKSRGKKTIIILGAGKAGMLSAAAAKKILKDKARVIVLEKNLEAVKKGRSLSFVDDIFQADLLDASKTMMQIDKMTHGHMGDLVVNCVNVPGTEMSSILSAKKNGTVLFFNMATNFQKAVLGAEGVGHETQLLMGNGYYPGHGDLALNLIRLDKKLRNWFE
ncbi:MAG: L-erythro-3,5-diaminohexanoate dehydrogenase [Deltaproteobacteria bacterium]|nr:MAG: L-erythro-3,5-diaminohexanoate dehydrogenase [Deltaproteobacteria bacterium]